MTMIPKLEPITETVSTFDADKWAKDAGVKLDRPKKHWSMTAAIQQIEKCSFECEGGPLKNNDAWRWLVGAAKVGPEYWPGQGVWFQAEAEVSGVKLTQWVHFYIVGCHMDCDSARRFWTYDLSFDPPAPYHFGTVQFTRINGEKLQLEKPEAALSEGRQR
jgi:hypothetical protein